MSRTQKGLGKALVTVLCLALVVVVGCGGEAPPDAPEVAGPTQAVPELDAEPSPELVFALDHDGERIHSVAFSPDGSAVAAGIYLEARLWSIADGSLVGAVEHRHAVEDVAFSPDGALLGAGQSVYGAQLTPLVGEGEPLQLHPGYNNCVAFAPDGERVATGNRKGIVWLWRATDGEQLAEWEAPDADYVTGLAFSPDGQILAAGHSDGTVHLWDAARGELLRTLEAETDYCRADGLAFSPDGEVLAVAGARVEFDHVVRLWSVSDGSVLADLPLSDSASDVAYSPDGGLLAAASGEKTVVWNTSDWSEVATLGLPGEDETVRVWVTSVAFCADGSLLAAGRWHGVLEIWRLAQ